MKHSDNIDFKIKEISKINALNFVGSPSTVMYTVKIQ